MKRLQPIVDAQLAEDVAWRFEFMDLAWGLDGEAMRIPRFVWRNYQQPSEVMDHEHCVGCFATISTFDAPGVMPAGWVTVPAAAENETPPQQRESIRMAGQPGQWLCPDCHRLLMDLASGAIELQWTYP